MRAMVPRCASVDADWSKIQPA